MSDIIDQLVGIEPGSLLDSLRARRPDARTHAQASYTALFTPVTAGGVTAVERFAVATFVVGIQGQADIAGFYAAGLAEAGASDSLQAAIQSAIAAGMTTGPYGDYPAGPLSAENAEGPIFHADATAIGARLAAAFGHAHMLVFHPRDSAPDMLQALLDAGWSTTDIVTLSQLVSFLCFQIRVIAGLRIFSSELAA
jgi:CMD domain protein